MVGSQPGAVEEGAAKEWEKVLKMTGPSPVLETAAPMGAESSPTPLEAPRPAVAGFCIAGRDAGSRPTPQLRVAAPVPAELVVGQFESCPAGATTPRNLAVRALQDRLMMKHRVKLSVRTLS